MQEPEENRLCARDIEGPLPFGPNGLDNQCSEQQVHLQPKLAQFLTSSLSCLVECTHFSEPPLTFFINDIFHQIAVIFTEIVYNSVKF